MIFLSKVPDFIRRGRMILQGEEPATQLLNEMATNYQIFKNGLEELRARIERVKQAINEGILIPMVLANLERILGLGFAIGIVLNCVLGAIDIDNIGLQLECEFFSQEILMLSEGAKMYRPIGAGYMQLCLFSAWIGTTDPETRLKIEEVYSEFRLDYIWANKVVPKVELEEVSQQLRLLKETTYY
jgi:hypothetical protein